MLEAFESVVQPATAGLGTTIAKDAAAKAATVNRDLVFIFSSYLEWNSEDVTPRLRHCVWGERVERSLSVPQVRFEA